MAKRITPKQTTKQAQQLPKLYCGPGPICRAVSSEACNTIATILQKGNCVDGDGENKQVDKSPVPQDMLGR